MSIFKELYEVDVGSFIEQKEDSLNYVSWVNAYTELRSRYPKSMYEIVRFPDGHGREVIPYLKTEVGYFVEVAVTVEGDRRSCQLPVMDDYGQTLFEPTATDINFSIQRCLVKAIALHGLGLYVYAGEEKPRVLPQGEAVPPVDDDVSSYPILKDIRAIEGTRGGYYVLDLQIENDIIEVAVVNELMHQLDEISLSVGDPCEVVYEQKSGKLVAKEIRKAS